MEKVLLSLCITLFLSCSKDCPDSLRENIHGVWAADGYIERLKNMHNDVSVVESFNDTIDYVIVDLLFETKNGIPTLIEDWSIPNPDSITQTEFEEKSYILVKEVCIKNKKFSNIVYKMFYDGDNGFWSKENNGIEKHLKYSQKTHKTIFTVCNKDKKILSKRILSLLYGQKNCWGYERYNGDYESDVLNIMSSKFRFNTAFYCVKDLSFYIKNNNRDSIIAVTTIDSLINDYDFYEGNTKLLIHNEKILSHLKFITKRIGDPIFQSCSDTLQLQWAKDTIFLLYKNNKLEGYYIKVN